MAVSDTGPYFHGTRADLQVGDLLTAGFRSNYDGRVVMNHIYFTALPKGAGLAAEMAQGDGRCRVYIVEPTGAFEDKPGSPLMRSTSGSSGSGYAQAWERSLTEARLPGAPGSDRRWTGCRSALGAAREGEPGLPLTRRCGSLPAPTLPRSLSHA
jgi:hypothetical protein